jgi:hypothetical protein
MRTTIRIDDELLKEAKAVAAASGTTLTEVVETALREDLHRRVVARGRQKLTLPTHGGGRFQPGVDLDDSAGLLDIMDEDRASS